MTIVDTVAYPLIVCTMYVGRCRPVSARSRLIIIVSTQPLRPPLFGCPLKLAHKAGDTFVDVTQIGAIVLADRAVVIGVLGP